MAAHAEWRDDVLAFLRLHLAVELAQASGHRLHVLHLTSGIEADWLENHGPSFNGWRNRSHHHDGNAPPAPDL